MRYGLAVPLAASGVRGDLGDAVEHVAGRLAELQDHDRRLLDLGIGADATNDTVDVELTVEAGSPGDAVTVGLGWLRTAIHNTGGHTPRWDGTGPRGHVATYEIINEEGLTVRPLERLIV